MTTDIKDMAAKLREMADALEAATTLPPLCEDMSLKDAWKALASIKNCSIKIDICRYNYTAGTEIEYSVYDGRKNHESKSLAQAIRMALEEASPHDTLDMLDHMTKETAKDGAKAL